MNPGTTFIYREWYLSLDKLSHKLYSLFYFMMAPTLATTLAFLYRQFGNIHTNTDHEDGQDSSLPVELPKSPSDPSFIPRYDSVTTSLSRDCTGPQIKFLLRLHSIERKMSIHDWSEYHDCQFCQAMTIDIEKTYDPVLDREAPITYGDEWFFFKPTLQAVLSVEGSCPLASWLCASWSRAGRRSGRTLPTPAHRSKWNDLRSRSAEIQLCGKIQRLHQRGFEDSVQFGLFNPQAPLSPLGVSDTALSSDPLVLFTNAGKCLL